MSMTKTHIVKSKLQSMYCIYIVEHNLFAFSNELT